MSKADLHLHSNRSDGILSPSEVVYEASKRHLTAIALTDHDTVEGVPEALEAGKKYGVEVAPGIEINTSADNGELHILGYYMDYTDKSFLDALKGFKEARMDRTLAIIEKLKGLGLKITEEQVLSKSGNAGAIGRPHIARALVDGGYVSNVKEAFEKYIGLGQRGYIKRHKLLPERAITLIKNYGGVPVLAHPGTLISASYIALCIKEGIQGIEAFHSRHDGKQIAAFIEIAKRHNLLITGGSDCHGEYKYHGDILMGRFTVDAEILDRLKDAATLNRETFTD